MSMNLHVEAIREVTVNKTGKQDTQTISFNLWQTPTKVTYEILAGAPYELYQAWITGFSKDITEDAYDDMDNVIGKRTYNPWLDHLQELSEWIKACEDNGYTINWYDL